MITPAPGVGLTQSRHPTGQQRCGCCNLSWLCEPGPGRWERFRATAYPEGGHSAVGSERCGLRWQSGRVLTDWPTGIYSNMTYKSRKVESTDRSTMVDRWINIMWSVHTVEYHPDRKKDQSTSTRANVDEPETMVLSERNAEEANPQRGD